MFALVCFDSRVKLEAAVKLEEPLPESGLFVACAGGPEIPPSPEGEQVATNQAKLRKADLVFVTDGGSDTASAEALRAAARGMGVTILGLGIGVEREWLTPWCDEIQVISDLTTIDDPAAEKPFAG